MTSKTFVFMFDRFSLSIPVDLSSKTLNISCNYTIVCFPDPIALSGLIITLIGLVLGLIIIFNRYLFTAPRKNNAFIVITLIILIVGAAFLMFYAQWYEQLISISTATLLLIIAIFLSEKPDRIKRKWKILLFAMCGGFLFTGFILMVVWLILKSTGLQVAIMVCWCGAMFIVMTFTKYYLKKYYEHEQNSKLYNVFVLVYENIILVITLQISLNATIDCRLSNQKMIEHNNSKLFH
ncbi:unnamed protein product [Schistosoma margrebowiei]|uniref:Uncharacterized protein n=1 Tax=Schistosoma margrebowiei TaxID=48269 RepID=A0AA85AM87_9TREM|nr:unnamed protein product [Schistosoma margrebowiei]